MKKTIGYVGVDLESREFIMRCEETNFGNMICDLMRTEYFTDFSMCNSGSFRKDAVIKQGPISLLYICHVTASQPLPVGLGAPSSGRARSQLVWVFK